MYLPSTSQYSLLQPYNPLGVIHSPSLTGAMERFTSAPGRPYTAMLLGNRNRTSRPAARADREQKSSSS